MDFFETIIPEGSEDCKGGPAATAAVGVSPSAEGEMSPQATERVSQNSRSITFVPQQSGE